jgi:tetratricopeptide (TPR) repeat protein
MSLEAIGRYTTMVLDWLRPSAEIGSMGKPQLAFVIVGSGVLLGTLVALTLLWRGMTWLQRALLAGVFAALLPVLHFVQLTIAVNAADRFLYIPLALLTLLAGTSKRFGRTWRPLVAVLIVLVTSIPATLARAKAWADPVDLWSSEYTQSGGTCETCRIELAKLQAEAGDFIPALRMQNSLMRDTARTGGVPGLVAMNSAILYLRIGEYERARAILDRLVQDAPGVPRFWRELATVQAATGHYEEAERSAQRALDLMPSYDNARAAIGLIRTLPKRAAQLNLPDLSDAQRADTLTAAGRTLEAERLWLQVLQTSSNLAELEGALDFLVNLGSSRAVTHVLTTQPRLLQNSPELAAKLRLKDELHRKLAPLESSARKPR